MREDIGWSSKRIDDHWRNFTIYIIRIFTMIVVPIVILLIIDDGCLQNWKSFWEYCDKDEHGVFVNFQCSKVTGKFPDLAGDRTMVCHHICEKKFVPYRCMRRSFEVLGPLYLYKMNIALWFPLLYSFKQTQIGKYILRKLNNGWKRFKQCKCCYCCIDSFFGYCPSTFDSLCLF